MLAVLRQSTVREAPSGTGAPPRDGSHEPYGADPADRCRSTRGPFAEDDNHRMDVAAALAELFGLSPTALARRPSLRRWVLDLLPVAVPVGSASSGPFAPRRSVLSLDWDASYALHEDLVRAVVRCFVDHRGSLSVEQMQSHLRDTYGPLYDAVVGRVYRRKFVAFLRDGCKGVVEVVPTRCDGSDARPPQAQTVLRVHLCRDTDVWRAEDLRRYEEEVTRGMHALRMWLPNDGDTLSRGDYFASTGPGRGARRQWNDMLRAVAHAPGGSFQYRPGPRCAGPHRLPFPTLDGVLVREPANTLLERTLGDCAMTPRRGPETAPRGRRSLSAH